MAQNAFQIKNWASVKKIRYHKKNQCTAYEKQTDEIQFVYFLPGEGVEWF